MSDQKTGEDGLKQALKAVHGMYIEQQISLLNALKAEFGPRVVEVVRQAGSRDVCAVYHELAEKSGKRSIDDLVDALWEPLRQKGYVFTRENTGTGIQMHCTACPFAAMYKAMGGTEWGYALYCAADADLTAAFNPQIGFKRTKTLMEGSDCCDHFYFDRE